MAGKLYLFDLLAPELLLGFNIPAHLDYLKFAHVVELHMTEDDRAVVYTGKLSFEGEAGTMPVLRHQEPSGTDFEWDGFRIGFRLSVPRQGAPFIRDGLAAVSVATTPFTSLFGAFGPEPGPEPASLGSEYPGVAFRVELLFDFLRFVLPAEWVPGKVDDSGWVVADRAVGDRVKLILPKFVLGFELGQDPTAGLRTLIGSWGDHGFEAPSDLAVGELCRMEPPIAMHSSGRFAIGLDTVAVDFSPDHTPPEILEYFGVDEGWQGFYFKEVRALLSDEGKDFGVHFGVKDMLISLAGEVSMEGEVIFLFADPDGDFNIRVYLHDGEGGLRRLEPNASASLARGGHIQVEIHGGTPPFQTTVRLGDRTLERDDQGYLVPDDFPTGSAALEVDVVDSRQPTHVGHHQSGRLMIGRASEPARRQLRAYVPPVDAEIMPWSVTAEGPPGYSLSHRSAGGTSETIIISAPAGASAPTVTVDGASVPVSGDRFTIEVPHGSDDSPRQIVVSFAEQRGPTQHANLQFETDWPLEDDWEEPARTSYVAAATGAGYSGDREFESTVAGFLSAVHGQHVRLRARASTVYGTGHNQALSERRLAVAVAILPSTTIVDSQVATGETESGADRSYQRVEAAFEPVRPAVTLRAEIGRTEPQPGLPAHYAPPGQPARAPRVQNEQPPVFRKIGFRFRLERNVPVMAEVSLRLDAETELEGRMRNMEMSPNADGDPRSGRDDRLDLTDDGVFDVTLNFTWDTATRRLTETLTIAADPDDPDGLFHFDNPEGTNAAQNILGGISLLLPVINSVATSAAENPDSTGEWVALAGAVAVPAVLGGLGWLQTRRWVFHGFELKSRQRIPEGEDASLSDLSIVCDYKVEFQIHIRLGDTPLIDSTRNMSVRYKAIGFNLHYEKEGDTWSYQPIFDTSKGYELDLGDPGVFSLPAPLGDILRIHSVRVARFNPLTLELDLGLKVDLGVVSVDRLKIKWPIEPMDVPTILPTGVSIDIPNAITGKGYLNFDDGFEGTLDISIVPVKVRVAASLAIKNVEANGRSETAVYAALIVEFPSPIVLGATGLGIYGFSGLFGMHYKRIEPERNPDEAVGPALKWLQKADGQPAQLYGPDGTQLWGPEIDRWSFGIGVIAGTIEGGTLINLTGTFVLELPGPRILIFVKVQIMSVKPKSTKKEDVDVTVGILGVLDLDFQNGRITIGVIINYEAKDLITLRIPVEIFFNLRDGNDWHVDIGTIKYPVEAMILNFVRATAFFMLHGDEIRYFPVIGPDGRSEKTLPGVALALGIEAALVLGDEDCGIYLKVASGLHVGIAFSPFFLAGDMYLIGELRLIIISIEAEASLAVIYATDPQEQVYVHGIIRGRIDLGLFVIEGEVSFTLGPGEPALGAPPALVSGMWLQSHAPVLTTGQGGDQPIDASLGPGLAVLVAEDDSRTLPAGPLPALFGTVRTGNASATGPGTLTDDHSHETHPELDLPVNGYKGLWLRTDVDGAYYRVRSNTETEFSLERVEVTPGAAIPAGGNASVTPTLGEDAQRGYTVFSPVPIDTVPVLQMIAAPLIDPAPTTFTEALRPIATAAGGWIEVSGERKNRYFLNGLALTPALPSGTPPPPATWRRERPRSIVPEQTEISDGERRNQNVDLALFSRTPVTTPYAHERSRELDDRVDEQFGDLCQPIAPAAPVLWTFCGQRLGASGHGWTLRGKAQPDPPGSRRSSSPPLRLDVREPGTTSQEKLVDLMLAEIGYRRYVGPRVIGVNQPPPPYLTPDLRIPGTTLPRLDVSTISEPVLRMPPRILTPDPRLTVKIPTLGTPRIPLPQPPLPQPPRFPPPPAPAPTIPKPTEPVPAPAPTPSPQPRPATNWRCQRALQLPWHAPVRQVDGHLQARWPGSEFNDHGGDWDQVPLADRRWIELDTGPALRVTLFLAIHQLAQVSVAGGGAVLIRELDEHGNPVQERPLDRLGPRAVTATTTGLPPTWTAAGGPWTAEVQDVATYLASTELVTFRRYVVDVIPHARTSRIRIAMNPQSRTTVPSVVLAAVEVHSRAEATRASNDLALQQARIADLDAFLGSTDNLPLLAPGTAYRLQVTYRAESEAPARPAEPPVPGAPAPAPTTASFDMPAQEFCFFTDDRPPARLDPWVLGTTPEHEARFHFADEPVSLVFNDGAIVDLYRRYGKELRMVLRPAGGTPGTAPGEGPPPPQHVVSPESLLMRNGTLSGPFRDSLARLQRAQLPCVQPARPPRHGVAVAPFELEPLMAYTLDVEVDPAEPREPNAPWTPLYRRSFQTSRFRNAAALAADVMGARMGHRCLSAALTLPAVPAGATTQVVVATDLQLEEALLAAGDEARPAAERAGITILWAPDAASSRHVARAVLIDAAEPLWRARTEPQVQTVPNQDDPAFQQIVPIPVAALEIIEMTGGSSIDYFVRSTAGTRTLAVLRPLTAAATLRLALRRPASTLFDLAEETTPLLEIPIAVTPPWEV